MDFIKKHWKKFVLAIFASLWTGCFDDSTSTAPEYGCPADVCNGQPIPESSESQESSSSENQAPSESSSSYIEWISSSSQPVGKAPNFCYKTTKTEYEYPGCEGDICPDYGVFYVEKDACECDDGVTYSIEELRYLYNLNDADIEKLCYSHTKDE